MPDRRRLSPRAVAGAALAACALPAAAFILPVSYSNTVVEYVNELSGHYLLLADPVEMAGVDRGEAGPGWRRTGHRFGETWTGFNPNTGSACRFYSPSNNSHFFTADPAECEYLRTRDTGWIYEKPAFQTVAPVGGACPAGRAPIYRLYNNRAAWQDANHRYTASPLVVEAMVAAGWIAEGIAFCPKGSWVEPDLRLDVSRTGDLLVVSGLAGCSARSGPCVAVERLPAMPTTILPWEPPLYITRNPGYPVQELGALTGMTDVPVLTGLAPGSPQLLERSFLQAAPYNSALPMGLRVNGADRLAGPYASMSPMYVLPSATAAGEDARVFPWRHRGESRLLVSAGVAVRDLRRSSPGAHAYGGPVLHLVDKAGGGGLWVTLQAFGTVPEADFVGRDVGTGTLIVSTSFRAQPAFGQRLSGDFARCLPEATAACLPEARFFQFAIGKADFARVLEMARAVDPALSPDPASYYLGSFRFQAETYLDASLAVRVGMMRVEIWP